MIEMYFQLNPGVMDDTATALRDPIFYRWHRFIDDLFQEYKKSLPPYSSTDVSYQAVYKEGLEGLRLKKLNFSKKYDSLYGFSYEKNLAKLYKFIYYFLLKYLGMVLEIR